MEQLPHGILGGVLFGRRMVEFAKLMNSTFRLLLFIAHHPMDASPIFSTGLHSAFLIAPALATFHA